MRLQGNSLDKGGVFSINTNSPSFGRGSLMAVTVGEAARGEPRIRRRYGTFVGASLACHDRGGQAA